MSGIFQWTIRVLADTASQMTSVERLVHYSENLPQEEVKPLPKAPEGEWPSKGAIEWKNFTISYGNDQRPVLRDLNLKIEAGEKIGIAGRTGAGKSSLILALFRMMPEPIQGSLLIDGVDIQL
jgi:ABC-type multidrug transport system fused ATPase/permease subunit